MEPVVGILKTAHLLDRLLRVGIANAAEGSLDKSGWRGITPISLLVLQALSPGAAKKEYDFAAPRSAAEIAAMLGCGRTRVSMELGRLRRAGWVNRVALDSVDERRRAYQLTERGRAAARAARNILKKVSRPINKARGKGVALIAQLDQVASEWQFALQESAED